MRRYSPTYLIGQAFKGLWRNGVMSVASILVLLSCLIVTGSFGLIVYNIKNNIDAIGNIDEITVFIDVDKTDEEIEVIQARLKGLGYVDKSEGGVRYISKADALEEMKNTYGEEYPYFFDGVDESIFPPCFVIKINNDELEHFNDLIEELKKFQKKADTVPGIEETVPVETDAPAYPEDNPAGEDIQTDTPDTVSENTGVTEPAETEQTAERDPEFEAKALDGCITKISYVKDVAEKLQSLRNGVIYIFSWFMIVLFFVSLFVIINTIKLAVSYRKQEISIMRYVGATNWFIMLPFIFEGIIIGLISSIGAYFIQKVLYNYLREWLDNSGVRVIETVEFGDVKTVILVAFISIGVITGVIGSSISLRKNLKA